MRPRWPALFAVALVACSKESAPASAASSSAADREASARIDPDASLRAATAPKERAAAVPKDANVIILSIDSLRADMPWSGYARPIAPRLTAFEAAAVSYSRAYSVSSYTSMSLGGLLGGRVPSELQRSGYFFGTYRHDVFFPKLLQKAGVHTMGVMAHMYFQTAGFSQGFDDWKIVPGVTFDPNTDRDVTSPQTERVSEELLGDPANASRRFFFWAHWLDPHDEYLRHEGIDWGKTARDRYDGEVTFTDGYVGRLLDFIAAQPWAARTVIVVTSDHGEEFGEHQMLRHGFEVWNTLVHVPLMIRAPGASPRRIEAVRSGLDIAPTVLELFGVAPDMPLEGKSLVGEVYGAPAEDRDAVVDLPSTSNNGRRRALVHGDEKIICFDGDALCKEFDLKTDPKEQAPVTRGPEFDEMKQRYRAVSKSIRDVTPYACNADCLDNGYLKKNAN